MALFCEAMRRDSVSLLRSYFRSCVQVFSCEMSLVCRLKYQHNCFYSHFWFLVTVVLFVFTLSVLLLATVISPCLFIFLPLCRYLLSLPSFTNLLIYLFQFYCQSRLLFRLFFSSHHRLGSLFFLSTFTWRNFFICLPCLISNWSFVFLFFRNSNFITDYFHSCIN